MLSHPSSQQRNTSRYYLGVDLGQAHDPTAIAIVRKLNYEVMDDSGRWRDEHQVFQVGHLERIPLGTPYPAIVSRVRGLLHHQTWRGEIEFAVDGTGVGRPVCDLFTQAGVDFTTVMITSGTTESNPDGNVWHVPKLTLVSHLQALLHEGRLQIQKKLPEAATLIRELQNFRVNFTDSGHMTFNARQGKHDDLVLALAIAVWRALRPPMSAENWINYYKGLNGQAQLMPAQNKSPHGWSFGAGPEAAPVSPTPICEIVESHDSNDKLVHELLRSAPKRQLF